MAQAMGPTDQIYLDRLLQRELRWMVRLRWIAGVVTVVAALADLMWLGRYSSRPLLWVGVVILGYNAMLEIWLRANRWGQVPPRSMAAMQILADLTCLTAMILWSGGARSPLLGVFVFHMVFASLLLPRAMAYATAMVSISMVSLTLAICGHWPQGHSERIGLGVWGMVLLLTVYLSNHTTFAMHRQRRRLIRQNRRVREMSRQIKRQQTVLIQQEKMAAMGQMAAGVAHEISNPLANIDSILQLAQRRPDHIDANRIQLLRDQAERIRRIIQSMTEFAHPTETHWQDTPINDLVAQAISLLKLGGKRRKVVVSHEPSPSNCKVRLQPHAMQQVLINLLLNAADAVADVPQPSVVVRCRCDQVHCMIDVVDNGKGIPPEELDRVFEPFYTTKPVGSGTGLGLSISYSLVESQGGSIKFTSQPGEGTTVTVALKRADRTGVATDDAALISRQTPAADSRAS